MSSGEGFGPAGLGAAESPPFAVAGPSQVTVPASRSGTGSFTVSNVTGRSVRARLLVVPGAGADPSWFQLSGESERALPTAGTTTVDVALQVPKDAPAGSFSFVLGAALEQSPDQVVSGPTVMFQVPEPVKAKFPWWIVIVAAIAVVLLAVGGLLIWNTTRPGPAPTPQPTPTLQPTPTPTPTHPVFDAYDFRAFGGLSFDLDAGRSVDYSVDFEAADLFFSGEFHEDGFLSIVGYMNASLAVVESATFEACEGATGYTTGEPVEIPAETTTFVCVRSTSEGRPALLTFHPSAPASGMHETSVIVWEE